jgi:hypothetical protein
MGSSVRWWWFAAAAATGGGGDDGDTGSPIAMKLVRRRLWVVFGRARPPLVPATAPALVGDSSRELVVDNAAAAAAAAIWLVERNDDDDDALPPPLLIAVAPPDSVYMLCVVCTLCVETNATQSSMALIAHTHTQVAYTRSTQDTSREREIQFNTSAGVNNPKCVCACVRAREMWPCQRLLLVVDC